MINQLPDAFTDAEKLTKSYIPTTNIFSMVIFPKEQVMKSKANELSIAHFKHDRAFNSRDMFHK